MRVTLTGATGLIGTAVVAALRDRGDEVTVLSRDPEQSAWQAGRRRAGAALGPDGEPAPAQALAGRDAVVNLAGEPVAQRWSERARPRSATVVSMGTRNLVEGVRRLDSGDRPGVLVSSSAIGYYGARGVEPIDEEAPAGEDFLAQVCADWEAQARPVERLGMRAVQLRTGVVLDRSGGALQKMLPPFRLGVGGPVAGGRQYVAWIHRDDLVGMVLSAAGRRALVGPDQRDGARAGDQPRALPRARDSALHRPSLLPVPGLALRALYGEMAEIVTTGVRAVPAQALVLGYDFKHADLAEALQAVLGAG